MYRIGLCKRLRADETWQGMKTRAFTEDEWLRAHRQLSHFNDTGFMIVENMRTAFRHQRYTTSLVWDQDQSYIAIGLRLIWPLIVTMVLRCDRERAACPTSIRLLYLTSPHGPRDESSSLSCLRGSVNFFITA